jgi:hypothetical protein
MPRKPMSLGDLHEMMRKYREVLAATRATQAYDEAGNLRDVDEASVRRAVESLDAAMTDVARVCGDITLAVIVDTE